MMAPESCRSFLAYMTAWLTTLAWQAIAVSLGYLMSTLIQGVVVLSQPTYEPKQWHTVLLIWAIMLFAVFVNSTTGRALAKFEGVVLILHLAGFFGILIPLVYLAPHNEPSAVFNTFYNMGGWSSQALSFLVGFPFGAGPLVGADCAVHMAEEVSLSIYHHPWITYMMASCFFCVGALVLLVTDCSSTQIQSAAIVVPRAIMATIFINGTLALAMVIAFLFCISDLEAALEASETMYYPFLQVFYSGVNSKTGAVVMAVLLLVLAIASSVGIYASASRMLWSFSRDKGLPFNKYLFKVYKALEMVTLRLYVC